MINIFVTTYYRLSPRQIEQSKELIRKSITDIFGDVPTNLIYSKTMGNTEDYELFYIAKSCDVAIFLGDSKNISQNFFFDYEKELFERLGKKIYYTLPFLIGC
jgi:hypothetical protein